jgi:hypothetical protein
MTVRIHSPPGQSHRRTGGTHGTRLARVSGHRSSASTVRRAINKSYDALCLVIDPIDV